MQYYNKEVQEYNNQGFEHNEADYTFGDFEFIGTCGSFPEQYDVVIKREDKRYQVGYVRLRGGQLALYAPDCLDDLVYLVEYDNEPYKGYFSNEDERVVELQFLAFVLHKYYLKGANHV